MARATAGRTSQKAASRSATSTAFTAKQKPSAKNKFDVDWPDWSTYDEEQAKAQGWGVFMCVDEKTKKVFLDIQLYDGSKRFKTNNAARDFVAVQCKNRDPLAERAANAVFRSKVGVKGKV